MADELSNLRVLPWMARPNATDKRMPRTRVGRGEGAGKGKTAGRGTKGQQSRSGYKRRYGFEGGQMPLHRRLPKRGFNNIFAKEFEVLNLERLSGLEAGTVVTAESLVAGGLIGRIGDDGVKLLGRGEVTVALHVRVAKVSKSAAAKIVAAGGTVEGPVPGSDE